MKTIDGRCDGCGVKMTGIVTLHEMDCPHFIAAGVASTLLVHGPPTEPPNTNPPAMRFEKGSTPGSIGPTGGIVLTSPPCSACGNAFKSDPHFWSHYCPECAVCEKCGSAFMMSQTQHGDLITRFRCLECLHYREVPKPPMKITGDLVINTNAGKPVTEDER